jgi:uncharacterized RDD family membrane protein YckC
MAMVKINTAFNVNIDFDLAGLDRRFFAWLIDFFIRILYLYIIINLLLSFFMDTGSSSDSKEELLIIVRVLAMLPVFFYFIIFEVFFNGQSIGKKIMKIRVASLDGYKPTVTQYLTRWVFRLVDLGFISLIALSGGSVYSGWISAIFVIPNIISIILIINSKKEQRLGDLASGTVVISLRPTTQISDTIFENVSKEYNVVYPDVLKLSDRDITIIKTAIQAYEKTRYEATIWMIAEKLQKVLGFQEIEDPYQLLLTVLTDYNYLTTHQ